MEWYRWKCNPRSRTFGKAVTVRDLKKIYRDRTRNSKPYEVYARLYSDAVESAVNAECFVEGVTGKAKLRVWHHVARDMYSKANDEEKEAVYKALKEEEEEDADSDDDDAPGAYERYVPL